MFSTLKDYIKNQKEFYIEDDSWENTNEENIDSLKTQLTENLRDEYWSNLYHNYSHIFKLGLLENEILIQNYKGWCGLTNYRFYYNSEDQGLLSIPISKIIKYHDYTYSKSEEVELAIEHFKNRGEKFKNHDIVWMTLQGGFDSLYNSGEVLHEKYLKKIVNEGECFDLSEEATKSIYKNKNVLKKKYPKIEKWDVDKFIANFAEDKFKTENAEKNNNSADKKSNNDNVKDVSVDKKLHPKSKIKLYSGERNFTTINEDKFSKSKTITWNSWSTQPSASSKLNASASLGIIWYIDSIIMMGVDEGLGMGMRLIEDASSRVIAIDYEYHRWDWWFLGKGSLKILIDGDEVIELIGNQTRTHVFSSGKKGGKIFEKGYWLISETDFKKVCDGEKLEIKISGGSGFYLEFEDSINKDFQFMLRSMYSESYDPVIFKEYLQERAEKIKQEELENTKKGKKVIKIVAVVVVLIILFFVWALS